MRTKIWADIHHPASRNVSRSGVIESQISSAVARYRDISLPGDLKGRICRDMRGYPHLASADRWAGSLGTSFDIPRYLRHHHPCASTPSLCTLLVHTSRAARFILIPLCLDTLL
jgi:hypothetical protein